MSDMFYKIRAHFVIGRDLISLPLSLSIGVNPNKTLFFIVRLERLKHIKTIAFTMKLPSLKVKMDDNQNKVW